MRHFLFEDKEYRINPRFKRRKKEGDSAHALARLLKSINGKHAGNRQGGGRKTDARQKCVVKAQYSKSIEAHRVQLEKYLVREGTDIDGSRAKRYGTDIEEYRNNLDAKNFRIFLSPQSNTVDLKALTERFVNQLEMQTGYNLHWAAANHYNTAHPHAHLLINGVDKNGKEVRLPRDVIKTFMRETARDICTSMIGLRTRNDMEIEREQALSAPRYTKLDDKIHALCRGTFQARPEVFTLEGKRMLTRLEHLRKMNLCVYKEGAYQLSPRWREDLQANGRYNAFLKARDALTFSASSDLRIFSGTDGTISGRVAKVYRTDGDASDNHAVVIEGVNGKAYFVPLFKKPELRNGAQKAELQAGAFITLKTYENQRGRLTPTMYKVDKRVVLKEIRSKGYTGKLAAEVLSGNQVFEKRPKSAKEEINRKDVKHADRNASH
jgi:hypothetical protein